MELYEETSFDDVQILGYVCNFGTTGLVKQEPPDDGYEQFAQDVGCSTDPLLENTFTASNRVFREYSGDTCQNSVVSSTVKLETDSCEVTEISNNDNFNEIPRCNSQTLFPNSYNSIPESSFNGINLPSSSNPNRKLTKIPNVTTFKRNFQLSSHSMDLDHFGRQTTKKEKSISHGNTNIVKRKRGRPPGQKNKNPGKKTRKNYRTSSETLPSCNQGLESYGTAFQKFYPLSFLGSNGVFNALGTSPCVKTTRKYRKRMPKPRCENDTTKEKPKLSCNTNTISEQHTNYASSSRNFSCDSSVIPPFPKKPDFQIYNTIQDKTSPEERKNVMPDEICNSSHASDISISNDLDQNIDNTITLPTSTQETAVCCNASEVNSLNPLQSDTRNLFGITSSDEDEGPTTVYQIKTNRQSNAMYNSNVLEECMIGKSNTTDKSLHISEENCNADNNTISLQSDELSSSYNIRTSSISPNFQNVVGNFVQEEANPQFPENELQLFENFNSNSMPQDVIKVSNGIIYPNNCDWRNFSYLVYTPDNTSFYAFDPKNPNVVSYMNENQSNVLEQDLFEFKLIQLEIRGNDKFGYLKHIQTSNNKRFECDNCTITYEAITTEDAKKVLDMSKYSRDYPYNCGQTIPLNDNYQKELVESHRVCFWNTSLYQGIFPGEDNNVFSQKESSNELETIHDMHKETTPIPCCRLLGLSDLLFEEIIDCVKNNERLKDLIEKEIESYNGKNQSLKALSTDTNITDFAIDVENNPTSDFNEVKIEPFELHPVSKNVPENFLDESLSHTNTNPTEDINSEDISFLDSLPSYSNSKYPNQVKNENPWTSSSFQQPNIYADIYSKEYQQNFHATTSESAILENTRSFSYQNNVLLSSRSCLQYINNSDMDYFNNRRCSNLNENNTLQGNFNYERNQHHQIMSNCSTNNIIQYQFPFGNTCPPALPFSSSHQFSASRSYSEFPRAKEVNYSSRFTTNSTETASFSNYGDNYIHPAYNAYNQSQATYRNASLHYGGPPSNQTIGEPSKYQRVNNIDLLKSNDKTISKLSGASFGRKPKNVEMNPAYRHNSGGTIINLNYNSYQDTSQPSPLNLSNSFPPNQYSYQSPVFSQYQGNSTTNKQQLSNHRSYPIYANEEPLNFNVSNRDNTKEPYNYQPPSGYNEFKTAPQSAIIETTPNLQMPIYNESSSHNPFLGVSRPSYQNYLDKITNSNSYRENSILNQKSLLETKETHHEISITDSNSNYIPDPTCGVSPLQILRGISTGETNVPENHTDAVKTAKNILTKNDKALSKNPAIKHRAAERFSSTSLVEKDDKKYLEECYQKEKKPNAETRDMIAKKINRPESKVNTWFKNRRQTEKKRKLNETLQQSKQEVKKPKIPKLSSDNAESDLRRCSEPSMPILSMSI